MKEKKLLDPLEHKVLDFINKESLLDPLDSILIGISGGSDSFALSQILFNLAQFFNWKISLAYVEHFIRKDTLIEKELIKKFAEERKLPFYFLEISKRSLKEKELREERYKLLEKLSEEKEINKIALGHTLDDQIESIIMNFLRGLGLKGLVGIPVKRGKIIRPLLNIKKEELREYCKRMNIVYHEDYTNYLPITLRNKVRWQLIPFLEKISEHFPESLLTQKRIAEEEEKFLNKFTEEFFYKEVKKEREYFEINFSTWENLAFPIKFRLLSKIFNNLNKNLPSETLIKIISQIEKPKRGFLEKIDFVEIYKLKDKILIVPQKEPQQYSITLKIPGETKLPTGEKIIAELIDIEAIKNINFQNPFHVYFDYDKIKLKELTIRTWKEGDRFKPFGLEGRSKKLQDFFVDKKIPRFKRNIVPLVLGKDEILWIVGIGRSDLAKIDENTKIILSIKVEKEV
ncbi:MAG: tRNA lysidine(34) synthetase TilS [Dictyoglomaceae bacterium]|nr:tRNA lysidine(34) synthetase TilS [Dictyoglomaceae bacterium]